MYAINSVQSNWSTAAARAHAARNAATASSGEAAALPKRRRAQARHASRNSSTHFTARSATDTNVAPGLSTALLEQVVVSKRTSVVGQLTLPASAVTPVGVTDAAKGVRVAGDTSLLGGLKRFFNPEHHIPPLDVRIKQALAKIDWSKPDIVLWMPGTSEYVTNPTFERTVQTLFPGQKPIPMIYEADWRFDTSVPDGLAVIRGVMDAIHKRDPKRKVLLAGQSQGAWIVSAIVGDPKYNNMVKRAALFGHPIISPYHYHDVSGKVVEINNPGDPVALVVHAKPETVMHAIDQVARGKILGTIPTWLNLAIHNPAYLGNALLGQLMRLPGINKLAGDPHHYETDFLAGVTFLKTGVRLGRASFPTNGTGVTPRDPK